MEKSRWGSTVPQKGDSVAATKNAIEALRHVNPCPRFKIIRHDINKSDGTAEILEGTVFVLIRGGRMSTRPSMHQG